MDAHLDDPVIKTRQTRCIPPFCPLFLAGNAKQRTLPCSAAYRTLLDHSAAVAYSSQ